jgi:iron(III) transport system substrate-binding protein
MRFLLLALGLLLACAAQAQAAESDAQRMQRLATAAKHEGRVLIYTSMPVEDMRALTDAFEARYGIKTAVWRASSEKVVARIVTEARAGRFDADIVETNGPDLEALHRKRLLQPVRSPAHADLIAEAMPRSGAWAGTRLSIFVQAFNTRLVRREDLPRRWEDLLSPQWKGRLAIEIEDADWFSGVAATLGEARAIALFRDIVAVNGVSVRKGHSLIAQLVAAGEIPLALTVYNYKAQQLKDQGAPLDWFAIPPAIAKANGIALTAKSANPNAALLFYEFALSREGQQILLGRDYVPTHRLIDTPLNRMPLKFIDARAVLDDAAHWQRTFSEIFRSGLR